jgi:tRNA modification GTPase
MNTMQIHQQEVICALATPSGVGAIAIIRVSGLGSIALVNSIFSGKNLENADTHTVHFGTIRSADEIIDEVLVTVFKTPKSFTKEDSIEISCHGSDYIIRQILKLLITKGARIAKPGEFTQRAFLNGQFDLVQAEAVADLIAADSQASHKTALNQLRGGFSKKLASLRSELIHFASLIELELDFGEEDVEFAEREDLRRLINALLEAIAPLIESFDFGNAIKEGVPVAIIGSPNVGKSTLLNALLNEEKAIVTSIAGTTRDVIEDTIVLNGLKFRFIDTAGIRETVDLVESIGIERSKAAMEKADIVIFLFDSAETLKENQELAKSLPGDKEILYVLNKIDVNPELAQNLAAKEPQIISISAQKQTGILTLTEKLVSVVHGQAAGDTVVTNLRHYEHLVKTMTL